MTEKICTVPSHDYVYSTKRQMYICPFCEENPPIPDAVNIARRERIQLYDYQREILHEDGHRVMVAGRQTGKTTTAALEVAAKSRKGKVLHLLAKKNAQIPSNITRYIVEDNVTVTDTPIREPFKKFDHIVVDEPAYMKRIDRNAGVIRPNILQSKSCLIVGSPVEKGKLLDYANSHEQFKQWHIPMMKCPHIDPSDIGVMRQDMSPEAEKIEIEAEFV